MKNNKVAVYGAGKFGQIFCEELENVGINVDFFIDAYTSKTEVLGKPIYRLENVKEKDLIVYVSTLHIPSVINNILKAGYTPISFKEACYLAPNLLVRLLSISEMWFDKNIENMLNPEKIKIFSSLLKDEKSIHLLAAIQSFREKPSANSYVDIDDVAHQYFPIDIPIFNGIDELKLIDCGAFVGDTLKSAVNYFKSIDKKVKYIASFEPDEKNLEKLLAEAVLQKNCMPDTEFIVYPCGVWSENKTLSFNTGAGSASSINLNLQENAVVIPCVALDKTLIATYPNYIKMDIEGSEQQAIEGAKNIISQYSPILAISLYHRPADLWEIPLLINSINPNYDMYIRLYGELGLETVLYCVPKK